MARRFASFSAISALLLAGCVCPPVLVDGVVQLPCCHNQGEIQAVNISTGTAPWRVMVPTSPSMQNAVAASNPAWTAVQGADWIGPPGEWDAEGDYTYEVRFAVPQCPIGRTITVNGTFAADNRAAVFVGSSTVPVAVSQGTYDYGFLPASVTPFAASFSSVTSGVGTLRVVVSNSGGPTGLSMQAAVRSVCGPAT